MNAREERGLIIAATQKLTQKGKVWLVPSQAGKGKYTVHPDPDSPYCSCPDHEETGGKCKHIYAVECVVRRELAKDGTITEIKTVTLTQKKTYKQDWPMYNLAQIEEKRRFMVLLHDLCQGVTDPPQPNGGRRRTPMADMVFVTCLKVYTTLSSRRFGTELAEVHEKGQLSRKLHPVMVNAILENELLTPALQELIVRSSLPLRSVETEFAVDSSGFSTSRFVRWHDEKYGKDRSGKDWVKCHMACGFRTHVVTAAIIEHRDAADCPQFNPLVKKTAENFKIGEVSADKAYLSAENIEAVFAQGGTPFIAFKENSTGGVGGLFEKMFHFYSLNKAEYMAHYHKRSNIESTNSMIKAKFRDHVRSRTNVAMKNEVLAKILCHNICCLIKSQVELGIEAKFWGEQTEKAEAELVPPPPPEAWLASLPATADVAPVIIPAVVETPPAASESRLMSACTICAGA